MLTSRSRSPGCGTPPTRCADGRPSDLKAYIFPLLFLKRISQTWDADHARALEEFDGDLEAALLLDNYRFQEPDGCHWPELRKAPRASHSRSPGQQYGAAVSLGAPRCTQRKRSSCPPARSSFSTRDKGFGFASRDDGGDVFVPKSALPEGFEELEAGIRIEFGVAAGKRGEQALSVRALDAPPTS